MPSWLIFVALGLGGAWLLRKGQEACDSGPAGGPTTRLRQRARFGPAVGDLSAPSFAPPSQNPPVTTQVHSEIVSGVRQKHNRTIQAGSIPGARYAYPSPAPTLPGAPDQTVPTEDVNQPLPYRTWLPYVVEPSVMPTERPVQQTRVLADGLLVAPETPPPNTVVFADIVGPVDLRKKLGSY